MDSIHDIKKILKSKALVSKIKRQILKRVWLVRLLLLITVAGALFLIISGASKVFSNTRISYYYNLARHFVFPNVNKLSSQSGKINFVVLGKGGQNHEAPDLTDTIMFVSVNTGDKKSRFVSLPRDIWIPALRAKINSAYYWGNQKQENGGLTLAKSTVEEVVGEPVSYAVVFNFSGFKDLIDAMGGVEVNISQGFVDPLYPIAGREDDLCGGDTEFKCRYERVEFATGTQHMNGDLALKYVRSRHAEGDQGTDIARANRQQEVIEAVRKKLVSKEILLSPKKLINIYWSAKNSIETDLTDEQLAMLARYIYDSRNNIKSQTLSEDLLTNPPVSANFDYQYVFIPKVGNGNWQEIHTWVESFLNN